MRTRTRIILGTLVVLLGLVVSWWIVRAGARAVRDSAVAVVNGVSPAERKAADALRDSLRDGLSAVKVQAVIAAQDRAHFEQLAARHAAERDALTQLIRRLSVVPRPTGSAVAPPSDTLRTTASTSQDTTPPSTADLNAALAALPGFIATTDSTISACRTALTSCEQRADSAQVIATRAVDALAAERQRTSGARVQLRRAAWLLGAFIVGRAMPP